MTTRIMPVMQTAAAEMWKMMMDGLPDAAEKYFEDKDELTADDFREFLKEYLGDQPKKKRTPKKKWAEGDKPKRMTATILFHQSIRDEVATALKEGDAKVIVHPEIKKAIQEGHDTVTLTKVNGETSKKKVTACAMTELSARWRELSESEQEKWKEKAKIMYEKNLAAWEAQQEDEDEESSNSGGGAAAAASKRIHLDDDDDTPTLSEKEYAKILKITDLEKMKKIAKKYGVESTQRSTVASLQKNLKKMVAK